MKYLLLLSFALNIIFFWQLQQKPKLVKAPTKIKWKTNEVQIEKYVVRDEVKTVAASPASAPSSAPAVFANEIPQVTDEELREMNDKVQEDRQNYLIELGISEERIDAAKHLMQKYNDRISKIYMEQNGLISREQRREVIEIEEEMADALAKHYGVEKFKKFEEYRKKYNDQIFEAMKAGDGMVSPFVLMEL